MPAAMLNRELYHHAQQIHARHQILGLDLLL